MHFYTSSLSLEAAKAVVLCWHRLSFVVRSNGTVDVAYRHELSTYCLGQYKRVEEEGGIMGRIKAYGQIS